MYVGSSGMSQLMHLSMTRSDEKSDSTKPTLTCQRMLARSHQLFILCEQYNWFYGKDFAFGGTEKMVKYVQMYVCTCILSLQTIQKKIWLKDVGEVKECNYFSNSFFQLIYKLVISPTWKGRRFINYIYMKLNHLYKFSEQKQKFMPDVLYTLQLPYWNDLLKMNE